MIGIPNVRRSMLALAAAAALLVVLLAGEWVAGEMRLARIVAPPPLSRPQQERAAAAGETAAPPESVQAWVQIALGRPLMNASRQPAAVSGGSELSLSNGLPRLAGTLFKTDGATAIFARDDAGHAVIVRQGGMLGSYRVSRIEPDAVTLVGPDGAAQTLRPKFGTAREGVGIPGPYLPGPMNMPGGLNMPGVVQPPPIQPDNQDNQ